MHRYIAICFLFLYAFSATELHEYLKLPQLVMHFNEHQQEEKDMTLWAFLCQHYAHGNVFDGDRDKDMKLPFKSNDCSSAIVITTIPSILYFEILNNTSFFKKKTPNNFYTNSFCSINYGSIWQPPKIA
ncbi:MAG: hypothetical protein R2805_12755 [Flavobacterium sp.]|jgi:hypothetical protein|uniref:hypothetical protein n=1 Tax=Flavobacterium sp. TaxID=239 RepID=UPI002FD99043|nr:hypothetical protein [Bacteroidota bacterium]